jgi:hypothetical protein
MERRIMKKSNWVLVAYLAVSLIAVLVTVGVLLV